MDAVRHRSYRARIQLTQHRLILGVLALNILLLLPVFPAAAIEIQDSLGTHHFEHTPTRIVALNWNAVENLLELGVKPTGVAECDGYRTWVKHPLLGKGVHEVGPRYQPNLEAIALLKPDLIIVNRTPPVLLDKLQLIAPVLSFHAFSNDHDNASYARQVFLELAKLFNAEDRAKQRLIEQAREISQLKLQIQQHFNNDVPPITIIRINDLTHIRLFDDNSFIHFTEQSLGLKSPLKLPKSKWGAHTLPLLTLAHLNSAVLYLKPFTMEKELTAMPMWQAMPFVRQQALAAMAPSWTYGGISSQLYLARSMTDALLKLPANTAQRLRDAGDAQ